MLKQAKEKQLSDFCRRDAFGTKIAGYFKTYSDGFPGVRFWIQENGGNAVTAAVCRAYDSVVLSAAPEADFEELLQFLRMIGFSTLSCEESVCKRLGLLPTRSGNIVRFERLLRPLRGEAAMPRYPDLREVYSLLTASGFDRLGKRNEWIADVSRRMNAGTARWSVIYGGETLAACACALFVVDSAVFLGCVAAREDMRGRGLGSEAVLTLADRYASEGRRAELFCKDGSIVEFYKKSGFAPVGRWAEYDSEQEI